jgi:hypothetical protein
MTTFLSRIKTGWTVMRILYIFMGSMIIYQAIAEKQWLLILFGAYFASMGLFNYGCASGNCATGQCETKK